MDSPFLSLRDRIMLIVFTLAVCLPACGTQDVTLNEAFLLEASSSKAQASELVVKQPVIWAITGVKSLLFFVEPIYAVRLVLVLTVLALVVGIAALGAEWYGRRVGLLTGAITVTMFGLSSHIWQADVSIMIAVASVWAVRLFSRLEFQSGWRIQAKRLRLMGNRNAFCAFFLALGLAILSIDHQIVLLSILVPLLIAGSLRLRPMTWSVLFLLAAAGPVLSSVLGGSSANQLLATGWTQLSTFSGYSEMSIARLAVFAGAWLPMLLIGFWTTRHEALGGANSRERLLWCWALIPPIMCILHASLARSLVIVSGGWSLIAALGLVRVWDALVGKIPQLKLESVRIARVGFTLAGVLCVFVGLNESVQRAEHVDAAFLAQVRGQLDQGSQLLIDPTIDLPRQAFAEYHLELNTKCANSQTQAKSNPSTENDREVVYIVADETARKRLSQLGRIDVVMQSEAAGKNGAHLTLFRIAPAVMASTSTTGSTVR